MTHARWRTRNMKSMFVTLDVSQLETSSSKVFKPENSSRMFVIDETSQPEIGPYVLRAVAWSLTHIWTAVSREALVTKDGGGGGGAGETQPEPKAEAKTELPAQAEWMSSLFALDNSPSSVNIEAMSVTRDMSKLSGWLNAGAICRVTPTEAHGGRHEGIEAGGRGGGQ